MFRMPRVLKKATRTPKTSKGRAKKAKFPVAVAAVLTAAGLASYAVSSGVSTNDPASAQPKPSTSVSVDAPVAICSDPGYDSWQAYAALAKDPVYTATCLPVTAETLPVVEAPKVDVPVVTPPVVAAPADTYVHNLYPTTPAVATTTPSTTTTNATTVDVLPDCPKGQTAAKLATDTATWQCVVDPTVKPVVVAPTPVTPVVVPVPTTPTVTPVVVAPVPLNPEMDPFVFNLKIQASYFSWIVDPMALYTYGQRLCAAGKDNPFALENPLLVPIPVGDGVHLLTPGDVLYAITTAYTFGCPQAPLHNPEPVLPTLLEIANHMPPMVVDAPVTPVAPVVVVDPAQPANVIPPAVVTNPANDVVLTP